jgi:hypothetical protein
VGGTQTGKSPRDDIRQVPRQFANLAGTHRSIGSNDAALTRGCSTVIVA